jgi:hypothetical protein
MSSEPEKHVAPAASSSSNSDIETVHSINEKQLLRRLDLRLLPAVSILYLLSFLDRSNGTPCLHPHLISTNSHSRKRTHRRPYNRFKDDRKPVSHWTDTVLHRLRLIRITVQHHPQADDPQVLAPYADDCVGHCRHVDGCYAKFGGIFCGAVFVGVAELETRGLD